MTTTKDVLSDLLDTVRARADTLRDMAAASDDSEESLRLKHKASGVALAASYIDDTLRGL